MASLDQHILKKNRRATNNVLDFEELATKLDNMQPEEAVVLVSTGPDGISSDIMGWDALAKNMLI